MKISTKILLVFSIILLLSILDSASNYLLSLKVERNIHFLNKSQEIIRNSGRLHKAIIDMQSSFRGYLLTSDTNFLDGFKHGTKIIPSLFAEQINLVKGNYAQMGILDSIRILHMEWKNYASALINSNIKASNSPSERRVYNKLFEGKLKKQIGKNLNDQIANMFSDFDKSEYRLRKIHSSNLIVSIDRTHKLSAIFFILTIIIGVFSILYIVWFISRRIQTMVLLAEGISSGSFATVVDNKNDELTNLTTSLNKMSGNLSKTIKELQNRNTELDNFAYVVSHDLKAPLRGIHNAIKWIEEDFSKELSPQVKNYLDIIPKRTKRMEDLINGLLDYARLRKKTPSEIIDVNEIINEISAAIVPKNIKVDSINLPVFETERLKLEQVFTNLISNSVKYIHHDHGRIIISCMELPGYYQFTVKDNGIGIEPEYHDKIFELFQTLREKEEKESTGIGLSIVKKIIDEQQGTIKVNSYLDKGAEFTFTWPSNKPN